MQDDEPKPEPTKELPKAGPPPTTERAPSGADSAERQIAEQIASKLPPGPIQPEQLAELFAQIISLEVREISQFHGPLPPPKMLKEYGEINPAFSDRIMKRSEKEQDFRHEMGRGQLGLEQRKLSNSERKDQRGQWMAFGLAILAIGGGIWLSAAKLETAGLTTIITAVSGLSVTFIASKVTSLLERQVKTKSEKGDDDDE
jgi:uncharacterized membrane protein